MVLNTQINNEHIHNDSLSPNEQRFLRMADEADRRNQRLHDCGKWGYYFDPHTGKQSGFVYSCDLFRECPICRKKRANREKKWMFQANDREKENFVFVRVDDAYEANRLLRGVGKKQYVRYPQQDGSEVIFLHGELSDKVDGEEVTHDFLRELDWETIVTTPEGRNKSGAMHSPPSPKNPEKFQIIEIQQFIPSAPVELVDEAMRYAISQTLDLLPEDALEVRDGINQRTNLAIDYLRKRGHSVNTYKKKIKVILSQINWQKYVEVSDINLNINTKNST